MSFIFLGLNAPCFTSYIHIAFQFIVYLMHTSRYIGGLGKTDLWPCGESIPFLFCTKHYPWTCAHWGIEPEVLPEHDSSHSIDGKEQPDDEGIAVEQHPAVL